ncbi:MAG: hypothetical protein ACMUIE_06285 [Thermoplasmatota archaeon]
MDYCIVALPKGKGEVIGKIVQDDLISRQTIVIREASSLGKEGEGTYLMIEGSAEAVNKAIELIGADGKKLAGSEAEELYEAIKKAEDDVAEGLGLMFG